MSIIVPLYASVSEDMLQLKRQRSSHMKLRMDQSQTSEYRPEENDEGPKTVQIPLSGIGSKLIPQRFPQTFPEFQFQEGESSKYQNSSPSGTLTNKNFNDKASILMPYDSQHQLESKNQLDFTDQTHDKTIDNKIVNGKINFKELISHEKIFNHSRTQSSSDQSDNDSIDCSQIVPPLRPKLDEKQKTIIQKNLKRFSKEISQASIKLLNYKINKDKKKETILQRRRSSLNNFNTMSHSISSPQTLEAQKLQQQQNYFNFNQAVQQLQKQNGSNSNNQNPILIEEESNNLDDLSSVIKDPSLAFRPRKGSNFVPDYQFHKELNKLKEEKKEEEKLMRISAQDIRKKKQKLEDMLNDSATPEAVKAMYMSGRHDNKFQWCQYFSMLAIYFFFYCFALGPLVVFVLYIIEKFKPTSKRIHKFSSNKSEHSQQRTGHIDHGVFVIKAHSNAIARNLRIWGMHKKTYFNYAFFILHFSILEYILNYSNNFEQSQRIYMINFCELLVVTSLVCIKFGFMNPYKYKKFCSEVLSEKDVNAENMFEGWRLQDDDFIMEEIQKCMARQEVEDTLCFFSFMVNPKKERLKPLLNDKINLYYKYEIDGEIKMEEVKNFPRGKKLAFEMLKKYRGRQKSCVLQRRAIILSVIKMIACTLYIIVSNEEYTDSKYLKDGVYLIGQAIFLMICNYLLVMFAGIFLVDLKRTNFLMNQMSHLISPIRIENEDNHKKLYPTLNLLCSVTLRTWESIRKIFLDYGKQFSNRLQVVLTCYVILYLIILVFLLAQIFNFIPKEVQIKFQTYHYLVILFDVIQLFLLIFKCILLGGKINYSFDVHQTLVSKNLVLVQEVTENFTFYAQNFEKVRNPAYREITKGFLDIKNTYKYSPQELLEFQDTITTTFNYQLLELELQKKHSPYKVLNVAMNNQVAFKVFIGLVSLIITIGVDLYFEYQNQISY